MFPEGWRCWGRSVDAAGSDDGLGIESVSGGVRAGPPGSWTERSAAAAHEQGMGPPFRYERERDVQYRAVFGTARQEAPRVSAEAVRRP